MNEHMYLLNFYKKLEKVRVSGRMSESSFSLNEKKKEMQVTNAPSLFIAFLSTCGSWERSGTKNNGLEYEQVKAVPVV